MIVASSLRRMRYDKKHGPSVCALKVHLDQEALEALQLLQSELAEEAGYVSSASSLVRNLIKNWRRLHPHRRLGPFG